MPQFPLIASPPQSHFLLKLSRQKWCKYSFCPVTDKCLKNTDFEGVIIASLKNFVKETLRGFCLAITHKTIVRQNGTFINKSSV